MKVKCGKIALEDPHVMLAIKFRDGGTYSLQVAVDDRLNPIRDKIAGKLRKAISLALGELVFELEIEERGKQQ